MIAALNLGLIDYGTALRLQESLAELRKQGRIPDVLLLLEHPPVITLGRNAKESNVVATREFLAARDVEVFEINRGGDVTFHGPGQLVGYPIFDLRGFSPRLGAVDYVRKLEEVLIRTCAHYGIPAQRIKGMTGVWAEAGHGEERKIAAIGVHISRGVTSHGFALNITTDLEQFKLIVPCGLAKPVTSIAMERGAPVPLDEVVQVVARQFGMVFSSEIVWLESFDDLPGSAEGDRKDRVWPQDTPVKAPENLRRLRGEDTHLA